MKKEITLNNEIKSAIASGLLKTRTLVEYLLSLNNVVSPTESDINKISLNMLLIDNYKVISAEYDRYENVLVCNCEDVQSIAEPKEVKTEIKVTYYSDARTKYIVNVSKDNQDLYRIASGTKEYYKRYESNTSKKSIIQAEIQEVEYSINKSYLKSVIDEAINKNKKSVNVSTLIKPVKQFKEQQERQIKSLEDKIKSIKSTINYSKENLNGSYESLIRVKSDLENNILKNYFTSEELIDLDTLIIESKVKYDEFKRMYKEIYNSADQTVFSLLANKINYYVITDKKNKSESIIDTFYNILVERGFSESGLKENINNRYMKYDRELVIRQSHIDNMEQLNNDNKLWNNKEYIIAYELIDNKLNKVIA
jgi:hypothetical protein